MGPVQHQTMKWNLLGTDPSIFVGIALISMPGWSKEPELPRLTIRVMDYVNVPAGTLGEVEATAIRILSTAGVSIGFRLCFTRGTATGNQGCGEPLGPADLILRIVRPNLGMRSRQLGYAVMTPEGGAMITLMVDGAAHIEVVTNLSYGTLLGHGVAHEIGHLLLGPNSHSSAGIMRPVWRREELERMARGLLGFEAAQATEMRSALVEHPGQGGLR